MDFPVFGQLCLEKDLGNVIVRQLCSSEGKPASSFSLGCGYIDILLRTRHVVTDWRSSRSCHLLPPANEAIITMPRGAAAS